MKAHYLTYNLRRILPLVAAASAMMLSACSSNSSNAGAPAATVKSAEKKPARKEQEAAATEPVRSVFSIDQNSRDPFYPKKKKTVAEAEPTKAVAQVDVFSLLREGFQGTIGSGDQRIGLINNVMVEAGRQSEIPIGAGTQARTITVRCREVDRDSVVLDVQGYSQPVRIARAASNF